MATAKIAVRVFGGDVEVETAVSRPVRLTPDGYAGVSYAGSVYPIYVGDVIDLGGPSWEIADCNRFILAGADIPYALIADVDVVTSKGFAIDWHVESNQFGHSVVFNAPERVAGKLVEALEAADLSVQRWDVSQRVADNGIFYDWFARLRFKGRRDEVLSLVEAVLSPSTIPEAPTSLPDPNLVRLADAEARIETLIDQLYDVSHRAAAAEREVGNLREALKTLQAGERGHRELLALAETRRRDLQQKLMSFRQSVASGPEVSEMVKGLAEAGQLCELALAENATLVERVRVAELEAESQRGRGDALADELDASGDRVFELESLESERLRAAIVTRPRRGGVIDFIPLTFPRLEFVLDSMDVIANLDSPAAVMRTLAEIERGRVVGRGLEGFSGWFEVSKLATGISGSEALGRIYYKPGGERVIVSVQIKQDEKQQSRHLSRLLRL